MDNHSVNSNDVDSVWDEEISARVCTVDEGTAIGVDYDEVMGDLERRFA